MCYFPSNTCLSCRCGRSLLDMPWGKSFQEKLPPIYLTSGHRLLDLFLCPRRYQKYPILILHFACGAMPWGYELKVVSDLKHWIRGVCIPTVEVMEWGNCQITHNVSFEVKVNRSVRPANESCPAQLICTHCPSLPQEWSGWRVITGANGFLWLVQFLHQQAIVPDDFFLPGHYTITPLVGSTSIVSPPLVLAIDPGILATWTPGSHKEREMGKGYESLDHRQEEGDSFPNTSMQFTTFHHAVCSDLVPQTRHLIIARLQY